MDMFLQPMAEPVIMVEPPPAQVVFVEPPPAIIQPVIQPQIVLQAAPPPPTVTVVQAAPTVVMQPHLGETPGRMKCIYCHQEIVTVTRPINGALTWTIFGVLFAFLIWPCCLIPFCVPSCRDIEHTCPNCRNVVSIYRRM